MIKKTISVSLGKEDYIIALMSEIEFKEIGRTVTGGNMSEERIQLTFEGYAVNYREDFYLKIPSYHNDNYFYFYSLRIPDGYYTNSEELFKREHEKANKEAFSIHYF